jgi:ArsR family transcriptional regulator
MFKALSNPNRLSIFLRLVSCCAPGTSCSVHAKGCECVGELGKDLGIAPSTVSHHIKELSRAGLIRMERRGQNVECWADPETLNALVTFLHQPVRV